MSSFDFSLIRNRHFSGELSPLFCQAESLKAQRFHQGLAGYAPTPLYSLDALAELIGVKRIWVKDESQRFELKAFKMLGGVYAIAKLICEQQHWQIEDFDFQRVRTELANRMTFTTATDGNHGRGVAWAAQQLGQKAVIYMPKGSALERVENIRALGAECIVTELNYDDTVRVAMDQAYEHGWHIVQDTAWPGYSDIPTWIMQGYSTLAQEASAQMAQAGEANCSHVVLQGGVGAMAGGVLGVLAELFSSSKLKSIVIEPNTADCLYQSAASEKGEMVNVGGDLTTIMAGLACGEPNPLGWEVLRNCATHFVSGADDLAALGMRVLGNPLEGDPKIVSGESGAIGAGLLAAIHFSDNKDEWMQKFELNADSVVLLINTEGDTDAAHYREVTWFGRHTNQ